MCTFSKSAARPISRTLLRSLVRLPPAQVLQRKHPRISGLKGGWHTNEKVDNVAASHASIGSMPQRTWSSHCRIGDRAS